METKNQYKIIIAMLKEDILHTLALRNKSKIKINSDKNEFTINKCPYRKLQTIGGKISEGRSQMKEE